MAADTEKRSPPVPQETQITTHHGGAKQFISSCADRDETAHVKLGSSPPPRLRVGRAGRVKSGGQIFDHPSRWQGRRLMGPGQSGGEASALGGRTLVSTNDICNIILSGVTRLGLGSLLKCRRGSGGGIYGKW